MKTFKQIVEGKEDDVVTFTVPLFIRLMEYAREDAKTDMDLHFVAEQATSLMDDYDVLDMDCYKELVSKSSK